MVQTSKSLFLTDVARGDDMIDGSSFPWSLPVLQKLTRLSFSAQVTFFVGENGSGKSTLLEGLAVAADAVALGGHDLRSDPTLVADRLAYVAEKDAVTPCGAQHL